MFSKTSVAAITFLLAHNVASIALDETNDVDSTINFNVNISGSNGAGNDAGCADSGASSGSSTSGSSGSSSSGGCSSCPDEPAVAISPACPAGMVIDPNDPTMCISNKVDEICPVGSTPDPACPDKCICDTAKFYFPNSMGGCSCVEGYAAVDGVCTLTCMEGQVADPNCPVDLPEVAGVCMCDASKLLTPVNAMQPQGACECDADNGLEMIDTGDLSAGCQCTTGDFDMSTMTCSGDNNNNGGGDVATAEDCLANN